MIKNKIFLNMLIVLIGLTFMFSSSNGNASVGSVTIDGKIYNQISFRPEIPMGKLKLGLDLYFYLDDEGNFYDKPWDFSSGEKAFRNILDKILYLQYGGRYDKVYFRLGGMPNTTLGYGIIVNQYNNTIEYPNIRRLGFEFRYNGDNLGTEFIVSDIKRSPGLIASRTTFPITSQFKIGVFGAVDLNQAKGLIDTDDDGYPDYFDHSPNDSEHWSDALDAYNQSSDTWDTTCEAWGGPEYDLNDCLSAHGQNVNNFDISAYGDDAISAIGVDASYKLTKNLTLYSQFAQLIGDKVAGSSDGLGFGFVPLAFQIQKGSRNFKWDVSFEARMNSRHFMYSFWDQTYDLNRAQVVTSENGIEEIQTKRYQLKTFGELKGLYFNVGMSMFDLVDFDVSYQDMEGETWKDGDWKEDERSKSILGTLSFDTSKIPLVHLAKIYYQRNNDTDFDLSRPTLNTIHGYDIGVELSSGVVLVYKGKTTYLNDPNNPGELKSNFTLQVETLIAL